MSKSLDFCKIAASDPDLSDFSYKDWDHAGEIDSEPLFDEYLKGERATIVTVEDNALFGVRFNFDPDANFEYFTSASSILDAKGTLPPLAWQKGTRDCMVECAERVMYVDTYDIRVGRPDIGNIVLYTIGNFIALGEHDDTSGVNKTTVLLPLKMRILPEGVM